MYRVAIIYIYIYNYIYNEHSQKSIPNIVTSIQIRKNEVEKLDPTV